MGNFAWSEQDWLLGSIAEADISLFFLFLSLYIYVCINKLKSWLYTEKWRYSCIKGGRWEHEILHIAPYKLCVGIISGLCSSCRRCPALTRGKHIYLKTSSSPFITFIRICILWIPFVLSHSLILMSLHIRLCNKIFYYTKPDEKECRIFFKAKQKKSQPCVFIIQK